MQGVIAQIYYLKISNACTTALKNILVTSGMAHSLPIILVCRDQIFCALQRLTTTSGQLSPDDIMNRPKTYNIQISGIAVV